MADVTARDGSASDYRYHARAIIAALKHHEHCYPYLGISSHVGDLDRCAKSLGITVPIELEGPSSIEMANRTPPNANRVCPMGSCTIRYPDGSEETSSVDRVSGIALLFDIRDRAIVALEQWLIYLDRQLAIHTDAKPRISSDGDATLRLMGIFANGIADHRIRKAAQFLDDDRLTANEKLTRIDVLIPIPPTASAEQLGKMLKVKKQAVLKTDWWDQNRKGEKKSEIGRRREGHRKRAQSYEPPDQDDK